MTEIQQRALLREISKEVSDPAAQKELIGETYFQNLKEQAREEVKANLTRLAFRKKYNLPPNDPRFLSLTDEDIIYELVLQYEYDKHVDGKSEEEAPNREIFKTTKEFDDVTKRLEKGEDIDLHSLLPEGSWEKING